MGFWNDVKQEWTWEGFKADFKEHWPDFLTVFIAGWLTPVIREKLGWEDNFWTFLVIWIVIVIATGVVIGLTRGIIKRISYKEL